MTIHRGNPQLEKAAAKTMLDLSKRWFVRYGLAVLAVGLALLTTSHVDLIATSTPFALFFGAVVGTTWYGGRLPGFVALILSVIVCDYFIIPPYYAFIPDLPDAFKIGIFITVSFFLVMVVAAMHKRERSIRASEAQYRTLFEYAPDGIIIASPEGYYLDANASMGRMLGYRHEELIGMQASDTVSKAEMEHIGDALDKFKPGTEYHREGEFRRKNGSVFVGDVRVTTMPNGNLMAIIRDGTHRLHAETTIRQSQKRLADAQHLAHIGSWDWDLKTNFLAWSDEHYRIFGLSPSDSNIDLSLEGIFSKCVHAEDVGDLNTTIERSRKTLQPFSLDFRVIHPDGSIHTIHSLGSVSADERGIAISMRGTAQDVTEVKRAESLRGVISEILQGVATTRNLDEFLKLVHRAISEVVYAENCFVMLHDPERDTVYFEFWVDKKDPQPQPKRRGTGFASYVLRTGLPLRLTREARKKLHEQGEAEQIGSSSASWLGVPLRTPLRTIGVLVLQHYDDEHAYSEQDLEFLSSVGNQIALAIDRKRAEDALSESNEKFHQLAENISEVFWITSPDFTTRHYVSAAYELIWGRSAESLYANPHQWIESIVPAERESAFAQFAALTGTTKEISVEYRIDRPDGTVRWIHDRGFQVKDVSGKLISITGIASDITDRKLTEAALEESEASFKSLFNTSNDAILVLNEGIFLACNPRAEILFGCEKQDLVGNSPSAFSPQEQPDGRLSSEKAVEYMEAAMMGVPQFFEWKHTRLDGTLFDAEVSLNRVDFGGATRLQGTVRDITERNLAEQKLRSSEELLAKSQEIAHLGSWDLIIPETGNINQGRLRWSDEVYRIFGYEPKQIEITSEFFFTAVHPDDRAQVAAAMAKALAEGGHYRIDHRILRPDGSERFVHEHSEIIRDKETGKPVKMVGTIQDITIPKLLGEQLRQSQKMEAVGVLAGGIAHDFNNLLTAINGYSDLTLRKMSPDDPLRLHIEEVRNAGTRAAELTSQLLAFSRKQVLRSAVINLNTVVSNIEKMLRRIIRESIELRVVLDPQLGNVRADEGQIEQVIMNLAINARDAMPTGGTLTIETENVFIDKEYGSQYVSARPANSVKMTVTDTGEGMTVQTLDHIFEPFFTTKAVGKGTGLGLSTVYGIIKQSGGDINVNSEPGHGTTFKIDLPCVDEVVERSKWIDITGEKYLGTETILLVENEAIVRRLVGEILKSNGYHILEAADGESALSLCRSYTKRIDLLLTDMIMPNMGGSELRDKVVELLPDIEVLFMSGYPDDSIVHRGTLDSHIEFVEKPFTPDGLSRKVREVLERRISILPDLSN
jgi:PAS domain S-box-containing protein